MAARIITGLTIREARRRKVLWGLLILSALFLGLYALGLNFVYTEIVTHGGLPRGASRLFSLNDVWNFWLTAALYGANFLLVMMAVLISVDTLAGEISSGTIQSIAVKPLRRHEILLGKWLGFVAMLAGYTLLLAGGVIAITALVTGYMLPTWLPTLALMYVEGVVLLSVSFLGGTRLSTLATGVLGFGLFGVAFIGSWIEQIGSFVLVQSEAAVAVGRLASFVMPSEALWRYTLSGVTTSRNPFSFIFGGASAPDAGVVVYAMGYAAALLALAVLSFQRRDL